MKEPNISANRRRFSINWFILLSVLLFALLLPGTAFADDCAKDYRRAEDCLRTPGIAEGIATVAGATVVILVNGTSIGETILGRDRGGDDGSEKQDEEDRPRYSMELSTEDARTDLAADGDDALWVYGRVTCDKPEIDTGSITAGLAFSAAGPSGNWLILSPPQMSGGSKAVRIQAAPPYEGAELLSSEATVMVSAIIEGEKIDGPVSLTLSEGDLELKVEVW
jgi:hypothetical protein